ncbi:MAG: hypothetical protein PSV36_05535 [Algoriphagus sp.]|nr:hypothetical protein [Algoriphagus sp.]
MRKQYILEFTLIIVVILLSITGFWDIYFGVDSNPNLYHHLHFITSLIWLLLLLYQLSLIGKNKHLIHRKIGLSVLFLGPLLVATTTLLSVHSAYKGLTSGQGDFLIVQNVMVTIEMGFLIALAFIFKKQRKLHGALLLSTAILFMGIALFFTLISFVPQFKIEGPETFYRFETTAVTLRYVCPIVGLLFLLKDFKNGWPLLLAGLFFSLNELIKKLLTEHNLIQALTETVGSLNQFFAFFGSFFILFIILISTGIRKTSGEKSV